MEITKRRYEAVVRALNSLEKVLNSLDRPRDRDEYKIYRDSTIQRLEYCIDTFWKFLKIYLQEFHKADVDAASPRLILRKAEEAKILDEQSYKILTDCLAERNLTSHSYNEDLAEEIVKSIPSYYETMRSIIDKLRLSL